MAARRCCQHRLPFFSNLAPVQLSTLIASPPLLGPRVWKERYIAREGECQYKHCSTGFLQGRRVGKLISRYWFLTAARLLLCPRACWSAPLHLFTVHLPITLLTSRSVSPPLSVSAALLLSCLVQQLIRRPHHPFSYFLPPSPFFRPPLAEAESL